ncbi:unnamed protein product, partial [Hapterophycus canaliculatus]
SLVSKIEARHASLQSTEQERAKQQAFLLSEGAVDAFDGMPIGFDIWTKKIAENSLYGYLSTNLYQLRVGVRKASNGKGPTTSYKATPEEALVCIYTGARWSSLVRGGVTILARQDVVVDDAVAVATPVLQYSPHSQQT